MTHCYQFLDRDGEPLILGKLDDDICRDVLGIEPDPNHFCFEFNTISLAISTFGFQPQTLLLDQEQFLLKIGMKLRKFAAVVTYLICRGITARAWREPNS